MQNKKLEKLLVKTSVAALFASLTGIMYRFGRKAEEDIDKKYEKEYGVKPGKLF